MPISIDPQEKIYADALRKKLISVLSCVDADENNEATFRLREMLDRYLPDTIATYEAVPPLFRNVPRANGKTPQNDFLEQINLIHHALHENTKKLQGNKNTGMAKNRRFLEKIVDTLPSEELIENYPEIISNEINLSEMPLIERRTPQEIISERTTESVREYALKAFAESDYGKKYRYQKIYETIERPQTQKEREQSRFRILYPIGLMSLLEFTTTLMLHGGHSIVERILPATIVTLPVDIMIIFIYTSLMPKIIMMSENRLPKKARTLAWLLETNHPSVAPGEPREPETAEVLAHPAFIEAKFEYKMELDKEIQKAIGKGKQEYRVRRDAGVFI